MLNPLRLAEGAAGWVTKVIVAVNKIDKPDARVHEVIGRGVELLLDLNATDEQFNSPTPCSSGRPGTVLQPPTGWAPT